jgi:hypothetical protein
MGKGMNHTAKGSEEDLKELLNALEGVLIQACSVGRWGDSDYHLDSGALSYYADGLRVLAKHGLVNIESEYGRRVIAVIP